MIQTKTIFTIVAIVAAIGMLGIAAVAILSVPQAHAVGNPVQGGGESGEQCQPGPTHNGEPCTG